MIYNSYYLLKEIILNKYFYNLILNFFKTKYNIFNNIYYNIFYYQI